MIGRHTMTFIGFNKAHQEKFRNGCGNRNKNSATGKSRILITFDLGVTPGEVMRSFCDCAV
jgi:transposase-like protein